MFNLNASFALDHTVVQSFSHHSHCVFLFQNGQTTPVTITKKLCFAYDSKPNHNFDAGVWVNIALTFKNETFVLYINGVEEAREIGVIAPLLWADGARGTGFQLGGDQGHGATNFTVSDLRVSRVAREPGVVPTMPGPNVVTVSKELLGNFSITLLHLSA